MADGKDWGKMIGGAALGGALDIASSAFKNAQLNENADRSAERQKDLMNYQQNLSMKHWLDTNYSAQVEQLKKAGLNPALIYGMGGQGGQTVTPSASAPQGQHTFDIGTNMMQMAQIELMKSQADNIKADTNLKRTGGEGQTIENKIKNIELNFRERSLEESLNKLKYEADKMAAESQSAIVKGEVDINTRDAQIKERNDMVAIVGLERVAKEYGIELTKTQIEKIINDIKNDNIRVDNETDLKKFTIEHPTWEKLGTNTTLKLFEWVKKLYESE